MFAGLRELPKYHLVEALGAVRQQLAAVGAELAAAGTIEAADDIFFLDLAEAHRGLRGRRTAGRGRGSAGRPTRPNWAGGTFPGSCSPTGPSPKRAADGAAGGGGPRGRPGCCPGLRPRPAPSPPGPA